MKNQEKMTAGKDEITPITKARHRLQIVRKAIEFGLQAEAAYSETDYGDAEVYFAARALGEDPQCYQFNARYAKALGTQEFFEEMEGALRGLGYRVVGQRLVLHRSLEAPPELSPGAKRKQAERLAELAAEGEALREALARRQEHEKK